MAADRADLALYRAVATAPAGGLDAPLRRLSRAADHSKLWMAAAVLDAAANGAGGRRAAATGLGSVVVTSTIVNGAIKPWTRRPRPDRARDRVPLARHVRMPTTGSLPSGHAASAFAFAAGAGRRRPRVSAGLHAMAAIVAYSRVHVGVHFPGDVVTGALVGTTVARLTARAVGDGGSLEEPCRACERPGRVGRSRARAHGRASGCLPSAWPVGST